MDFRIKAAPIVLFVYNRPDHTLQVLNALSSALLANQSVLYIYSDGPKKGANDEENQKIREVRRVIRLKNWCKEVHIIESGFNKGLADSIVSGVTDVVNRHGRVIVLEDDIIVSKGFLKYLNEALGLYQNDEEVMHIAGSTYDADFELEQGTFFLRVMQCHGWATWKRAWDHYNHDALDHLAYFQPNPRRASMFDVEGAAYFMKQLRRNVSGELKSWAVRWYASWLRAGGMTLFPRHSLVLNIGFDRSGENCGSIKSYLAPAVDSLTVGKIPIREDKAVRASVSRFWADYLRLSAGASGLRVRFSKFMNPFWSVGSKISRRVMMKLFPELKPLLLAQGKLGWSSVVTGIKGSWVDETVRISDPAHISWCRIGARTYIGHNAFISYTEIGKFCSIGPNFRCGWGIHPTNGISTSPTFYSANPANGYRLCDESKVVERKKIIIGNDVFIGMNVTVMDGVSIGDGAVIGAGCLVSKDVPPYAIAVGCPMKILRYRFDEETREKLLRIKWWDWPKEQLQEVEQRFFDVEDFIERHIEASD